LSQPRRRLDSLNGDIFAALRSFMPHAPLANLPAKGKGWELTAALNTICHDGLKPAESQP
jgi:hypothetical protein